MRTKHPSVSLRQLLDRDLESISEALVPEFDRLAGKRLLITGGGGFLGYYLVQSVLYWNRTRGGAKVRVSVYDNCARGMPAWLESCVTSHSPFPGASASNQQS